MYCNLYLWALNVIYGFRLASSKKVFCIKDETLIKVSVLDFLHFTDLIVSIWKTNSNHVFNLNILCVNAWQIK